MLILIAAVLAASGTPVVADAPQAPARCVSAAERTAATGRARVLKLGEMPPGEQIKAVWRFDERGCPSPLVVRSRVGADGR